MINPLFLNDTLQHILVRLSLADFNNAKLVCRDWNNLASGLESRRGLLIDFHINESVVDSLQFRHSRDRVYRRLVKIMNRGQVTFLKEHTLYQLYCVSGKIDEDFLHLLDNNIPWFERFFSGREEFFLATHLRYACIIGNITLVKYLIEQKGCKPDEQHVNLAAASGRLTLVKYLLENQQCSADTTSADNIFYNAVTSGRVKLLKYLIKKFKWKPSENNFPTAVSSGNYHLIKYLHKTHGLKGKSVSLFDLQYSKSLPLIKYMVEKLGWRPSDREYNNMYVGRVLQTGAEEFTETAYKMGMLSVINYVESRFPLKFLKGTMCFMNAIESGSLTALTHLLRRYNVAPSKLKEWQDEQYILLQGIQSGKLDMVKFLMTECAIIPTRKDLLKYAIKSGNVSVVLYLVESHGYEITPELCKTAFYTRNLELISLLFSRSTTPVESCVINYFCKDEQCLIMIYHLLETGLIVADDSMLESVFSAYARDEDKEQFHAFYRYLIQVHHLVPTEEMVNWMTEKEQEQTLEETHVSNSL